MQDTRMPRVLQPGYRLLRSAIAAGLTFMILLASAASTMAGDKTDVVVMKNGDRFTCEIKGLSSGALNISLAYALGTISVEWSQVVHLESRRAFILKSENGSL